MLGYKASPFKHLDLITFGFSLWSLYVLPVFAFSLGAPVFNHSPKTSQVDWKFGSAQKCESERGYVFLLGG